MQKILHVGGESCSVEQTSSNDVHKHELEQSNVGANITTVTDQNKNLNVSSGTPIRPKDKTGTINSKEDSHIQDTTDVQEATLVDRKQNKFREQNSEMEKTVADKWKQWQSKYEEQIQEHLKERTWQNKVTGVKKVEVSKTGHLKYVDKNGVLVTNCEVRDLKSVQSQIERENQKARKSQTKKENSKQGGNASKWKKDIAIQDENHVKITDVRNKEIFHEVLLDHQQKKCSENKVRPKSAVGITNCNKSLKSVAQKHQKAERDKNCSNTQTDSSTLAKESKYPKTEREMMKTIINQFVLQNYDDGEWIHWLHDEPWPCQVKYSTQMC